MFIYRRRRIETDSRAFWLLGIRALVSVVVLATDWGIVHKAVVLDQLHVVYLVLAGLVFLTYILSHRYRFHFVFYFCLSIQFAAELAIEGSIVAASGGITSSFFTLFLLTIVSAAVSYRLIGTLLTATAAALAYIAVVYTADITISGVLETRFWQTWIKGTDDLFYTVFLRICIFYILAFISGYLAQKLRYKDEALASTSRELQAVRMETGDILRHLHSGLLTIGDNGDVAYFNQAAEDILKIRAREVRGRPIEAAFGRRYPELARRLLSVHHSQQGNIRGEIELETAPGQVVPLGISTSIMGSKENRRGVIAVFQDITEAKLMEERLRLKDRLAVIGELAAGIAHEIRNPLAAISGSVQVLANELDVQNENRKLLELIIKESSRLNDIITEFLFYSRIRPTVLGPISLGSVVEDVIEMLRHQRDIDTRIDLRAHLLDSETMVDADEDHLKQLLLNLVINAIDAIGDKTGTISIRSRDVSAKDLPEPEVTEGRPEEMAVDRRAAAPWLCLTVSDDGTGIPGNIREKIWQPFFSTKKSGTGLGLAIVQRLTENLSGQVQLESEPGEGTSIHIYLKKYFPSDKPIHLTHEPAHN